MSQAIDNPDRIADERAADAAASAPKAHGVLAEFEDVDTLLHAARGVRDAGYTTWDCFTPFPVHGLNRAMGLRPTKLPYFVLLAGLTGMLAGVGFQVYTMGPFVPGLPSSFQGYPMIISGKPFASLPAFIPVTFELTVLLAAITAFVGMLLLNRLPRLHHPVLKVERFRRVTNDRFFVLIETNDPLYDPHRTPALLETLGATAVQEIEE